MSELLDIYLDDPKPLPIRILDDMLKVIIRGIVPLESASLNNFQILVIDTDGTLMKNDTLKSSFNGADKFQQSVNIKDVNLLSFLASEEFQQYHNDQQPTSDKCKKCSLLSVCGGGMKLHRWNHINGFNNPSIYCADQLYHIKNMQNAVAKLYRNEPVELY